MQPCGRAGTITSSEKQELVAIKVISRQTVTETAQLRQEVEVLRKISHPNIVRFRDLKKSTAHFYLVLEYCAGGDLSQFLRAKGRVQEETARRFLTQIASGLFVLHSSNHLHRDLKPQNILLSDCLVVVDVLHSSVVWEMELEMADDGSDSFHLGGSNELGWSCHASDLQVNGIREPQLMLQQFREVKAVDLLLKCGLTAQQRAVYECSLDLHKKSLKAEAVLSKVPPPVAEDVGQVEVDVCSICYEDQDGGDEVSALPCGHQFHKRCVKKWLISGVEFHALPLVQLRSQLEGSVDPVLKLADFGFARALPEQDMAATVCGSPLYMAPEILRHEPYDAKADLWSVGAILYELLLGRTPFSGSNPLQLLANIETTALSFEGVQLSVAGQQFLRALLVHSPSQRLSSQAFMQHPYVSLSPPSVSLTQGAVAETSKDQPSPVADVQDADGSFIVTEWIDKALPKSGAASPSAFCSPEESPRDAAEEAPGTGFITASSSAGSGYRGEVCQHGQKSETGDTVKKAGVRLSPSATTRDMQPIYYRPYQERAIPV
eukprot:s2618_g8.t2